MRRGLVIAVLGIAALIICRGDRSDRRETPVRAPVTPANVTRSDPAVRLGSISGVVRDDAGPIAGAFVCADDATCVLADASGRYRMAVSGGRYAVHAAARQHRPAAQAIEVAGAVTLDFVLRTGGVEVTGSVADRSGGPIAHARIMFDPGYAETADDGTFSFWTAPGAVALVVTADGYVPLGVEITAPRQLELLMTPEGIITGTVIDAATRAPVAGVEVRGGEATATTGEDGAFRLARLPAGRAELEAIAPHGHGRSTGSVRVAVGETTSGVVIELHPAVTVTARVMTPAKTACPRAFVVLEDAAKARSVTLDPGDGIARAHGVLPGTYAVKVHCRGHITRTYPPLVVGTRDVEATWEVDLGGRIEGRITRRSGAPVEGTYVSARPGDADNLDGFLHRTTDVDGRFVLDGVRPGKTILSVAHADDFVREPVVVAAGEILHRDVMLDDVGGIRGIVRDADGRPLRDVIIIARPVDESTPRRGDSTSDVRGAYAIEGLPPGDYELDAVPSSRFADRARVARATVHANQHAEVPIALAFRPGAITGVVVDDAGRPVADVTIAVEEQVTAYFWRPDTMTNLDGTFVVANLAPGAYAVRATRGGASATAERVVAGVPVRMQLRATGSISGVVRSWSSTLDELSVRVEDRAGVYSRTERFLRTHGAFTLDDLPAGHFTLTVGAEGQESQIEIDLAPGERKRDVTIELAPLVTIIGRTLDARTRVPIADVRVRAQAMAGSTPFSGDRDPRSDASGRFRIERVALGSNVITCAGRGLHDTYATRIVRGRGVVDLGDFFVMRSHESSGESGLLLADLDLGPTTRVVVERVEPPASTAGIVAGDVITSIDGVETTGYAAGNAWNALVAPAGTKLAITLARGVTIHVVLASR